MSNNNQMLNKNFDTNNVLNKGAQELKESGNDWWCYVEKHPIQSMLFGVIGYFALKGMFKPI